MIVAKKTTFALMKRNCLPSPIDDSVRNLAMQGTENVTSPKQVYRTTRSQPAKNHHRTHTWESARHWADCRQSGMYGPPLCRKRKMKLTGWSAQMYSAFVGAQGSWP
jgi:hypothetical protein